MKSFANIELPPVTAAEIEGYLDYLAGLMERMGDEAELALPLWQRLEQELDKRKTADAVLAAARLRLTRSTDRTAAPS
jgi:hypothetical protein